MENTLDSISLKMNNKELIEELRKPRTDFPSYFTDLAKRAADALELKSSEALTVSLTWSEVSPPNEDCHYTHTKAETPFGVFLLTWKGWKEHMDCGFDETPWGEVVYLGWNTVESAQKWASEETSRRIAGFK